VSVAAYHWYTNLEVARTVLDDGVTAPIYMSAFLKPVFQGEFGKCHGSIKRTKRKVWAFDGIR
jgi:hypothetical protein